MKTARFNVYGRYLVDIERQGDRWVVYERGEGKRRERPDLAVPPDVTEEALGGYLDDLLHEESGSDLVVVGLDRTAEMQGACATDQGRRLSPWLTEVSAMEPINDVVAVRVLSRYVVELTFENGDVRVLDLEPLLDGPVFERHRPAISTGRSGPWCFRRGTFPSVEELIDAIRRYIDAWTERCEPFIWTKDVETILARANRQNELVTGR